MRTLIILCLAAVAFSSPIPQHVAAPQAAGGVVPSHALLPTYTYVPSAQFHSQNELGGYNYGYVSADGQGKNELRAADGSVVGTYSYIDGQSGKPVTVQYSAGPGGFQASGAHLPQPVPLPAANVQATQAHFAAKAAVAAAAPPAAAAPAVAVAQPQPQQIAFHIPGFALAG